MLAVLALTSACVEYTGSPLGGTIIEHVIITSGRVLAPGQSSQVRESVVVKHLTTPANISFTDAVEKQGPLSLLGVNTWTNDGSISNFNLSASAVTPSSKIQYSVLIAGNEGQYRLHLHAVSCVFTADPSPCYIGGTSGAYEGYIVRLILNPAPAAGQGSPSPASIDAPVMVDHG